MQNVLVSAEKGIQRIVVEVKSGQYDAVVIVDSPDVLGKTATMEVMLAED
ncbi:hypothetical protein F7734_37080 [Scytonema sp. UIC 10036]|nr:hypothetical protein [Scytonema sp. UIC 10036]MUG97633.1 hypothetical protein [Scytonema sp. UIC 10036]